MQTIANEIEDFIKQSPRPVLFLGAGASAQAGLPTWHQLLRQLAESVRSADPLTTQQMHSEIAEGNLLRAFTYYQLINKMPEGDKAKTLRRLLSDYDAPKVEPLAKLPFQCCVTTNFDRSFHDAFAASKGIAAIDYKLGSPDFRQATWETAPFIARIHGAVEDYNSVVLSEAQFRDLLRDEAYSDLLGEIFLRRNVLFVGFSFYDPAIRAVFDQLHSRHGSSSDGRHLALVPSDINSEFLQRASRLNVRVLTYDPGRNHAELWDGISRVLAAPLKRTAAQGPYSATKKFLAACVARAQSADGNVALKDSILEGVVSAIIQNRAPGAMTQREITEEVRLALGVREAESRTMISRALNALADSNLVFKQKSSKGAKYSWKGDILAGNSLETDIHRLADSVKERAQLQEKWQIDNQTLSIVRSFLSHLVQQRGWDLGASFAAGRPPENIDIESSLTECEFELAAYDKERLVRTVTSMIEKPTHEEARLLSELGRMSFALELAFRSPRSIFLRQNVLPRRIYFDASVLLPAIVPGHPFQLIYHSAIERLQQASAAAAFTLELTVCSVYLNEIITHRRNAQAMHREAGSDFNRIAHSDALYRGSSNSNVYVGAFANTRLTDKSLDFTQFLSLYAPYETEAQLKAWLLKRGLAVIDAPKNQRYAEIYSAMEKTHATSLARGKNAILIEHDAIQISKLEQELLLDSRTIFVTADRQLRDAAVTANVAHAAEAIMSHVGLVQFIDLMLGGVQGGSGLTQMLWSSRTSAQATAIRSYFVSRALEQYDAGVAMSMSELVEQHSYMADQELERLDADLESENPRKRIAALRILGELEGDYFREMNKAAARILAD